MEKVMLALVVATLSAPAGVFAQHSGPPRAPSVGLAPPAPKGSLLLNVGESVEGARTDNGATPEMPQGSTQARSQAIGLPVSFGDLPQVLKRGQTVVVTDEAGQKTKGKVAEVTGSSLGVLLTSAKRTFAERDIMEIRTADRVSNGVAIGLALGVGLGFLSAVGVAAGTESLDATFLTWVGASVAGAAIGGAIDASHVRGPVVYASGRSTRRVRLAPLFSRSGHGMGVSLLF